MCQLLRLAGNEGVGPATHFFSWWLGTPLADVLTAMEAYMAAHPELDEATTYWWVCDYAFSQTAMKGIPETSAWCKMEGLESLVQTMEPWEKETFLAGHPGWFDSYLSQVFNFGLGVLFVGVVPVAPAVVLAFSALIRSNPRVVAAGWVPRRSPKFP